MFAAGDATSDSGPLIGAIASERKCAVVVARFFGGSGIMDEALAPASDAAAELRTDIDFADMARFELRCTPVDERISEFDSVLADMDAAEADHESGRCLQCDLRLKIAAVKVRSSY